MAYLLYCMELVNQNCFSVVKAIVYLVQMHLQYLIRQLVSNAALFRAVVQDCAANFEQVFGCFLVKSALSCCEEQLLSLLPKDDVNFGSLSVQSSFVDELELFKDIN